MAIRGDDGVGRRSSERWPRGAGARGAPCTRASPPGVQRMSAYLARLALRGRLPLLLWFEAPAVAHFPEESCKHAQNTY